MPDKPIIESAVAILPVRDIAATMDFYADALDFERRFVADDGRFAIAVHGAAAVHFVETTDDSALHATAHHISIYLWVRGVDALYEIYKPKLDLLAADRVRAPFDQPYGMREFHVKDPDGCLLMFGEESAE
jgi:predicted enzyme related to lactoylglutathione lyase